MTEKQLEEIKERCDAATPGPWWNRKDPAFDDECLHEIITHGKFICSFTKPEDAAYIVAACNAVPELVQQIRELSGTVTRLGLMLADAYKYIDTARLPEIGTPVMAPPDLRDMIEKFRRENFTEDTAGAGGKDHA